MQPVTRPYWVGPVSTEGKHDDSYFQRKSRRIFNATIENRYSWRQNEARRSERLCFGRSFPQRRNQERRPRRQNEAWRSESWRSTSEPTLERYDERALEHAARLVGCLAERYASWP
jgi:hypothetical protein